ncbi:MAG TPA: SDR family NAD(P)-dependent oxidoreductase [Longimicrobium sp.]
MKGSMEGRVCVVTGATAGIGQAAAVDLARRGATLVLVARSAERAERTRARAVRAAGHDRVGVVLADLSVQAQVRAAAAQILERWPAVHVLLNNAGVYTRRREESADGIEMQLAVNHLAPFLLTHLLLDRLRAGAPARVVAMSSGAHHFGRPRWDDLQMRRGYNGLRQYSNTKLFNVLFTRELARRVPPPALTANALHPGWWPRRSCSADGRRSGCSSAGCAPRSRAPAPPSTWPHRPMSRRSPASTFRTSARPASPPPGWMTTPRGACGRSASR